MKILLHVGALALALFACAPIAAQSYDPAKDAYASNFGAVDSQCVRWAAVTPSDSTDLAEYPKAIYVGGAGDIAMIGAKAAPGAAGVTWKGLPASAIVPARPRRILATGTTATNLVACY